MNKCRPRPARTRSALRFYPAMEMTKRGRERYNVHRRRPKVTYVRSLSRGGTPAEARYAQRPLGSCVGEPAGAWCTVSEKLVRSRRRDVTLGYCHDRQDDHEQQDQPNHDRARRVHAEHRWAGRGRTRWCAPLPSARTCPGSAAELSLRCQAGFPSPPCAARRC